MLLAEAALILAGPTLFLVGSVLLLWPTAALPAAECYICGALCFALCQVLEHLRIPGQARRLDQPVVVARAQQTRQALEDGSLKAELLASLVGSATPTFARLATSRLYLVGHLLYVPGCCCFIPSLAASTAGCWQFVVGSAFFVLGAAVELYALPRSPPPLLAAILPAASTLLGGAAYGAGALLFGPWFPSDANTLSGVALFVAGSVLFLIGGACVVVSTFTCAPPRPADPEPPADGQRPQAAQAAQVVAQGNAARNQRGR
jgi:hypothetical protein